MDLLLKTRTLLWGRAGGHCSFTECRRNLFFDASETDDESLVGDIAHIVAESPDGPRGDSALMPEERRKYSNLILLCKIHHKPIDDQPNTFTVEVLQRMKADHEAWVKKSLSIDTARQRDHELYADIIDFWSEAASIDNWQAWTSRVFCSDRPQFHTERYESLNNIRLFLLGRIWPRRYPELEAAIENFGDVCGDLCTVFSEHARRRGDIIETEKFYKSEPFPPDVYRKLVNDFEFHVALIEDLLAEMTRAANYVCDKIRESIDPSYRLREGVLLITRGPSSPDFSFTHMRLEYRAAERTLHPYPGLDQFLTDRKSRDISFGHGTSPCVDE